MKKSIFLSFTLIFLCQACSLTSYKFFRSYITQYRLYEDIELDTTTSGNIVIRGHKITKHYSYDSDGNNKERYDELCKLHNDISYNTKRSYMVSPLWGVCSAVDFISIDVVSESDFDDSHSKGVSLNDIVRFVSISPKKFIDSKYSATFDWEKDKPEIFKQDSIINRIYHIYEKQNYFPINKLLSEIGIDEMQLLPITYYDCGFLVFDKEPTLEKEHTLTITIKASNGKTYIKTIKKTFK